MRSHHEDHGWPFVVPRMRRLNGREAEKALVHVRAERQAPALKWLLRGLRPDSRVPIGRPRSRSLWTSRMMAQADSEREMHVLSSSRMSIVEEEIIVNNHCKSQVVR